MGRPLKEALMGRQDNLQREKNVIVVREPKYRFLTQTLIHDVKMLQRIIDHVGKNIKTKEGWKI